MSIIVLGTVALDTVKTPSGVRKEILGGSAAHFAMSARLFVPVHLVAVVGEDFPKKHIGFLNRKGVILTSVIEDKGRTFRWSGEYKGDLNTAITHKTELGVLSTFSPRIHDSQKNIPYVFLANVDPDIQRSLLLKIHKPKLVGLDTMNYWIDTKRQALLRVLKMVDIFVANDAEARQLSGEYNTIKAAKMLRRMGPKMIVVKKGEHGLIFYNDEFIFSLPAYPKEEIIDPTGAGDTFAGGFMGYLAKSKKINAQIIKEALSLGTITASFNVEGFGLNSTGSLTIKKVNQRLKEFKQLIHF